MTEFEFTYGRQAFSAAYAGYHCVTLNLLVSSLKCSLWLLSLLTELLDRTRLIVAPATVQLFYVGWITPNIWVSNLNCWLALPTESLEYNTLMGV